MALKFWNIGKANAEIDSAASILAPALAKAGIQTIAVDGKTVAAAEAPLSAQITALIAAQPVVPDSQNAAEALVSNDLISKELDSTKTELALAKTSVDSLTRSNADLQGRLATADASVQSLTVKVGVLTTERDAAVNQFTSNSKELTAQKTALAERCLAAGCLELTEDGKPLAADASHETKLAAAMKLSHGDLFKAYNGAVNAAVAKTGVTFAAIPSGTSTSTADKKPEAKGRDRFNAAVKIEGKTQNA